jgi:DnaJ-class molecular chaperone
MSDSFYKILEIPETASIDEIKKAYRRLSMLYHPDKNKNNPEATAKFQKISEAYETLGDEEKKKEYDMTQNNPFFKMMGGPGGPHMGFPVEEIFSQFFGMGGIPFQNMASFGPGQGMGPNIRVFHNGAPVNTGFQKPTPIIKNIEIPIDKILTGTTIPVDIERWIIEQGNKIFENETLYVTVPKGIDEGEIIILREKGNIAREDCKGDIKIFIKIINDTEFKRSGLDLIYEKTITVKEALCGFSFELKYITGKTYTITNNSGNIISHGYRKMIPNMGFSREQHIGNLIIIFNVTFPEIILEESLEQLKKIKF